MQVGQFKKTLLALAFTAVGFYSAGTFAKNNAPTPAVSDGPVSSEQAQVHELTKVALQEWVQGLQKAFPYLRVNLKKAEPVGGFVHGVVGISMGYSKDYYDAGVPAMEFDVSVNVKPELSLVNGKVSMARLSIDGLALKEGDEDFDDVYTDDVKEDLDEALEKIPHELNVFIRPSGNLYAEFVSTGPFVHYDGDEEVVSIPSFSLVTQSYGNKELLKVEGSLPLMTITNDGNKVVEVKNITLTSKGHTIKNGYYDLNGGSNFQIESITAYSEEKGSPLLGKLSNLKVVTDTKVGTNGLYQGDFTTSFKVKIEKTQETESLALKDIVVDMKGNVNKLHADSYMKLLNMIFNIPYEEIPPKEIEALLLEMAKQSPEMNISKATAVLNGHQGDMTFNITVQPISKEEEDSNIYLLLLQKTRGEINIDFPIEWLSIIEPDRDRAELVEGLLENSNGFLLVEKNRIKSNISYIGGNFKVNGKVIDYRDYVPF